MTLCRRRLDAPAAQAAGLVLTAAPDKELLATAVALAHAAAVAPRDLVLLTKRSLREAEALTVDQAIALEAERQLWSLRLPTTADGLRAAAQRSR